MKKTLLLLAVMFAASTVHAQKGPFKMGKVEMRDLKMEHYPGDSSVNAAILSEYGYFNSNDGKFTHMKRIKIYTREGLNQLIFKAPVSSKGQFRGFVINEVDGKKIKEKISRDHIFVERSEGYSNVRIAPPNVREGSVVDILYAYDGHPIIWHFQQLVPVRYSELHIPINPYFSFNFLQIGYEQLEVVRRGKYIARNMPAFRAESYIDSRYNYMTGLLIDLKSVHINYSQGHFYKEIATSWKAINDLLYKSDMFYGRTREPGLFLNEVIDEVHQRSEDTLALLHNALRLLQENISWNEAPTMYARRSIKEAWDNGSGSSADMNFIFMIMLRKLGIEFHPVVISQRSRGKINPYYPSLNRMNYTLTMVKLGENEILIDASDKYAPVGMLPNRCINGGGFLINDEDGRWIDIVTEEANTRMNSCNLKIDEAGLITGRVSICHRDYGAVSFRRKFDKYVSTDEYLEVFEKENQGILVEDYESDIADEPFGQVTEHMTVEIDGNAAGIGDMITFNPVFINRMDVNPFKLEVRKYPVNFTTPLKEMSIFNLNIPEGYTVEQLPEPIYMITQDKAAAFSYRSIQNGQNIQLVISLEIKKPLFIENEYEELKMFYNLIVQKEQENIILKKKTS